MKLNIRISIISFFVTGVIFGQSKFYGNYPFDEATKIQLVIFENLDSINEDWSKIMCIEIPKINGKIDTSKFIKSQILEQNEIQELSEIIKFQKSDCSENLYENRKCNESGYGIIFYNKSGKIFEYIEICFNCREFQVSSPKIKLGLMCYDKYKKFEDFFNSQGLEVGKYRDE